MKTEKLFLVLFALILFSCKKEINTGPQNDAVSGPQYSIENNYLSFKTTKDYVSVAGDLQGQEILSDYLGKNLFRNMASVNKQVRVYPMFHR